MVQMGGFERKEAGFITYDCFCPKGTANQVACVEFRISHAYMRIRCFHVAKEAS